MSRRAVKTFSQMDSVEDGTSAQKSETPKKREFVVERDEVGLYFVRLDGGGVLPECMKGKFTSMRFVNDILQKYKEGKLDG